MTEIETEQQQAPQWAPGWAAPLQNGSGRKSAYTLKLVCVGDGVAGEVVERAKGRPTKFSPEGHEYLIVRVEGGQSNGGQLEADTWARLFCGTKFLRDLLAAEDPQPGDRLIVVYEGRENLPDGSFEHRYRGGIEKTEREGSEW